MAAARPLLRGGGDEQLHPRVRTDDGADVAPVEHRTLRRFGEAPLPGQQSSADLRHRGDPRGRLAHRPLPQARVGQPLRRQVGGRPRRRPRVVEVAPRVEQGQRDRAVEQTGIEMRQAVMQGEPLGERALARGGRAVDGDDEGRVVPVHGDIIRDHAAAPSSIRAPSASMVGRKLGKLVAIIAPSSTVTGLLAASPRTRKAMAMR